MQKNDFASAAILIWLCSALLGACSHSGAPDIPATAPAQPEATAFDYGAEIGRWKQISRSHPAPAERARAHYRLASLYLSYHNPSRDYHRAGEHLNIYVSLYPEAPEASEALDWLAALEQIERLSTELAAQAHAVESLTRRLEKLSLERSKLQQTNRELARNQKAYQGANKQLALQNRQLRQKIEKINDLDQMVEAKRKSFQ
jgi:hypothetical protein